MKQKGDMATKKKVANVVTKQTVEEIKKNNR
jgi:hypothetical protein